MTKEKNPWLACLKHIVIASLATFGVYMASSLLIAAIFEGDDKKDLRFLAAYIFMMAAYAIFFYRFHEYNRIDTYAEHTDKFSLKKELLAYIRADGKYLFIIYGICAVVTDISCVVLQYSPQNFVGLLTSFCLGPWAGVIHIPVVCSVLCFVYASAVACVLAMLRSHKIHQEDTMPQKR